MSHVIINIPDLRDGRLQRYMDEKQRELKQIPYSKKHEAGKLPFGFWEGETQADVVRFFQDRGIPVYSGQFADIIKVPSREPGEFGEEKHYRHLSSRLAWLVVLQQLYDIPGRFSILSAMDASITPAHQPISRSMALGLLDFLRAGGRFGIATDSHSSAVFRQFLEPLFELFQGPHGGERYRLRQVPFVANSAELWVLDETQERAAHGPAESYQRVMGWDLFDEAARRLLQDASEQKISNIELLHLLEDALDDILSGLPENIRSLLTEERTQARAATTIPSRLKALLLVFVKARVQQTIEASAVLWPDAPIDRRHMQGDPIDVRGYRRDNELEVSRVTFYLLGENASDKQKLRYHQAGGQAKRQLYAQHLNEQMVIPVLGDRHLKVPIVWRIGGMSAIDSSLKGLDKGTAVDFIADHQEIPPGKIVSVGDSAWEGGSDVPMLAQTGAALVPTPGVELSSQLEGKTVVVTEKLGPEGLLDYVTIATQFLNANNWQVPIFFNELPPGWAGHG